MAEAPTAPTARASGASAAPPPAAAVSKPTQATVEVGRPSTKVVVRVANEAGQIVLHAGKAQVVLPLAEAGALQVQSVSLLGGAAGVVRVTAAGQQAAALITRGAHGTVEIVWVGRLDLHGDPGERSADALEVGDRDGDGATEIVVGRYDERVRVCGQERTLLAARAVDPHDFSLHPIASTLLPTGSVNAEPVTASEQTPGPKARPILQALRPIVASTLTSEAGQRGNLASLGSDIQEEASGTTFVTLRWSAARRPIRTFAVLVAQPAAHFTPGRMLMLVGDHGQQLSVQLPAELRPGQRYWFTPKAAWQTTCLSVALLDPTPQTSKGSAGPTFTAIEAYTDLDFDGGLPRLVEELVSEGPAAADAADLLAQVDGNLMAPLLAAWPRLHPQGRRRVVRIAAGRAKHDADSLRALALGLHDPDAEVFDAALRAAVGALPESQAVVIAAASDPGRRGDAAAITFAHSAPAQALDPVLNAMTQPGGSERPGLRQAATLAIEHGGDAGIQAALRWAEQHVQAPVAGRAAAALALSAVATAQPAATLLVRASYADARDFPDQWRLVAAAAALPADVEIDAWLAKLAKSAEPWMLRAAALQALLTRGSSEALALATAALGDPYPRVRAQALGALAARPDSIELLSKSARNDKWFLVRSAAVSGLATHPEAEPVLLGAVGDRSAVVRAAAIRALGSQRATTAWTAIAPHVDDAKEYPEVIAEGVAFAKARCVPGAGPVLQRVVLRGLQPDAWGPDQELGLRALEALSALGGESAAWAAQHAQGGGVPEQVRAAALRAAKGNAPCRPE